MDNGSIILPVCLRYKASMVKAKPSIITNINISFGLVINVCQIRATRAVRQAIIPSIEIHLRLSVFLNRRALVAFTAAKISRKN